MSSPRPVVLCVIRRDTEMLVVEYDDIRDFTFYRPPGGGIEFGEHSPIGLVDLLARADSV